MTILLAAAFDAEEAAQWQACLEAALPGERWVRHREGADDIDIAVVANPPPGSLDGLSGLRLIQSLWAGVDKLLRDPTVPAGVPLARMVDPAMNTAMAETALWAVLHLHRDHDLYTVQQRERSWRQHPQRRADEVHVAVLGLGEMGRTTALRLVGNGYRVSGWSRRGAEVPGVMVAQGPEGLRRVLGEADIVINLLPLTPDTQGLFNATMLAAMRPGASLVNLARGGHVVEADLLAALDAGHLRHAVLDVFREEPLAPDHPFWAHPRVTVRPHVAAATDPRSAAQVVARNILALREGRPLAHLVDRSAGY
ncbi:2-hydroxyacid dehydrogenase [Caldimonas caldifontis]|uniref:Glyoxylate/hydroxypyruvate reductase A n=1 Tax=Caldimonas caldifontis TaxID=1452508 RepID=A0A2S5SUL4_9BURK|nr:glyoxylate/hydroxypyruvate reductase A [Caldimonas caldifontis]PPE66247.1 glyoxylate/hydroxypyruvate reductase A [Caldimonas caldifontis]